MSPRVLRVMSAACLLSFSCNLLPADLVSPCQVADRRLWLVMVWVNADSGGDPHEWIIMDDIEDLDTTSPGPAVHIVAQVSRCGRDPYDGGWKGTRRFIFEGPGRDPVRLEARRLADPSTPEPAGSARSLVEFVSWAAASFPAERRMLVIEAHGSGWQGLSPARLEQDPSDLVSIPDGELARALEHATRQTDIDLLVLDSCLMGMWETGWALRDHFRWVVTSQEMGGPLLGSWHDMIPRLVAGPDDPGSVCADIPPMLDGERTRANSATRTCIDLSRHEDLSMAVDGLSRAAIRTPGAMDTLQAAIEGSLHFAKPDHHDLGDLSASIAGDEEASVEMRTAAARVTEALEGYVVAHKSSVFSGVGASHGVCGGPGSWGSCGRSTGVAIWAPVSAPGHLMTLYMGGPWCETAWDEALLLLDGASGR